MRHGSRTASKIDVTSLIRGTPGYVTHEYNLLIVIIYSHISTLYADSVCNLSIDSVGRGVA
ncbi:hypothetical protein ANFP_26470 [Acidithiobacillus ferrooxidans]|jgi:hypothetical protein|nr:hypothetical protein ANFP_26470 [Acidithiobacillus ferrooxidans]